jgi:hypothetical protein
MRLRLIERQTEIGPGLPGILDTTQPRSWQCLPLQQLRHAGPLLRPMLFLLSITKCLIREAHSKSLATIKNKLLFAPKQYVGSFVIYPILQTAHREVGFSNIGLFNAHHHDFATHILYSRWSNDTKKILSFGLLTILTSLSCACARSPTCLVTRKPQQSFRMIEYAFSGSLDL